MNAKAGFQVIEPGFMTSIQDCGRKGYERFGVPASGAMDWYALQAANHLVGNSPEAAGLEFTLEGPALLALDDCLVASAGRGFCLWVQGKQVGLWMAALVRRGEQIYFTSEGSGGWGYLAIYGGLAVEPVLKSRSTYLKGGLGGLEGRLLQAGDLLPVAKVREIDFSFAGRRLSPACRPDYQDHVWVQVIMGPQATHFTQQGIETFISSEYAVSVASDRMGYRLQGPPVEHAGSADLLSEAIVFGSVQVPADGQPMAMMADRPTTGGYPKIATVVRISLPLLAQCPPGIGKVCFQVISVAEAQTAYRKMVRDLREGIEDEY